MIEKTRAVVPKSGRRGFQPRPRGKNKAAMTTERWS